MKTPAEFYDFEPPPEGLNYGEHHGGKFASFDRGRGLPHEVKVLLLVLRAAGPEVLCLRLAIQVEGPRRQLVLILRRIGTASQRQPHHAAAQLHSCGADLNR